MIFEVDLSILDKIFEKLYYLRFNDASFNYIEELYFSEDGRLETPWTPPYEESIIYRLAASWPKPSDMDFERNFESFKTRCADFFDETKAKTLSDLKKFLLVGTKDDLQATEIANWAVIDRLLDRTTLDFYLQLSRWLIRIPCGNVNINLVKIPKIETLFLEITPVFVEDKASVEKLQNDLQLSNGQDCFWTDLLFSHSIVEVSCKPRD